MDEYPNSLQAAVLRALELADAQDRYPVAAMLADICAMLDPDDGKASANPVGGSLDR